MNGWIGKTGERMATLRTITLIVVTAILLSATNNATAHVPQSKIENPGVGSAIKKLGYSVSVDGDTMIACALFLQNGCGVARVWRRDGLGGWALEAELSAQVDLQTIWGVSTAISGDTAVVGTYWDDVEGTWTGAAFVYTRSDGVWTQQAKLLADDAEEHDTFGRSVAISGDTIVVGSPSDPYYQDKTGSAYVFTRSDGVWTQQAKLTPDEGMADERFGSSVVISGETIIVGAPAGPGWLDETGAAYVFTRSSGVWTQQAKLTGDDSAIEDLFGKSVAFANETAIIGANLHDEVESDTGAAYVFTRSGSVWTQQAKLTADDAAQSDAFGYFVSISGDTAVVGAPWDDDGVSNESGSAYIFTRSGGAWTQQAKLTAADFATDDRFGQSVAISGDTAFVGSAGNDNHGIDAGAVYLYTHSEDAWTQQAKLTPDDSARGEYFGCSVSVSDDTAIIGVYRDEDNGYESGAAYVFTYSESGWAQQAKLTADDIAENDYFGYVVAISGNTAVIGSPEDDYALPDSEWPDFEWRDLGSAYVFTRSDGVWTQQAKLIPDDVAGMDPWLVSDDWFGDSVAVSGDTIVVGAMLDDDGGESAGAAYVFTRSGDVWTRQAKLAAADAEAG